ncbi:hypothetical protein PIB30_072611, partial [Stylosanthes scabra]|nr:hypothetical protein [Stylosanthes scabra]
MSVPISDFEVELPVESVVQQVDLARPPNVHPMVTRSKSALHHQPQCFQAAIEPRSVKD